MEKKDLESRMGKFVRDFRIYTETSRSVDYKVLRNGLRMFIQAELDRAREEGKLEVLEELLEWDTPLEPIGKFMRLQTKMVHMKNDLISKLTTK